MPLVSVLTPTILGREHLLAETRASVRAQTHRRHEHLVLLDTKHAGCATMMNKLAENASGEWLFPIADDDILLPRCLELHLAVSEDADIVYAPPLVWGEPHEQFWASPPGIPAPALIRASLWRSLDGYRADANPEDTDFYRRAMEANARFVRYAEAPTWVYRFWGQNQSRS